MNPIVKAITDTPLFVGMSGLELNAVSAFLEPRCYPRDSVIFKRGDPGTEMFIVRTGRVSSLALDRDGNERELYEFGPGRFFGEMSIIENEPRSATCVALDDTELLVLEGLDFYRLVWEYPMIGARMLSSMARAFMLKSRRARSSSRVAALGKLYSWWSKMNTGKVLPTGLAVGWAARNSSTVASSTR